MSEHTTPLVPRKHYRVQRDAEGHDVGRSAEPAPAGAECVSKRDEVEELAEDFVKKARVTPTLLEELRFVFAQLCEGGASPEQAHSMAVTRVAFDRCLGGCVSVTADALQRSWQQRPEADRRALLDAWIAYAQTCAAPWNRLRNLNAVPVVWETVTQLQAEAFAWVLDIQPRHLPSAAEAVTDAAEAVKQPVTPPPSL
eukprot:2704959-Rhodomonas_salina.1